jgi:hypothetical protein
MASSTLCRHFEPNVTDQKAATILRNHTAGRNRRSFASACSAPLGTRSGNTHSQQYHHGINHSAKRVIA